MISVENATIHQNATDTMPSLELRILGNDAEELHEFAQDIMERSRRSIYHVDYRGFFTSTAITTVGTGCRNEFQEMPVVRTPVAKKFIFNGPATIVLWSDGTKTVVKCDERDTFDPEKGVALCYMKKMCGNFNKMERQLKKARKESLRREA